MQEQQRLTQSDDRYPLITARRVSHTRRHTQLFFLETIRRRTLMLNSTVSCRVNDIDSIFIGLHCLRLHRMIGIFLLLVGHVTILLLPVARNGCYR